MPPRKPLRTLLDCTLDYIMEQMISPRAFKIAEQLESFFEKGDDQGSRGVISAIFQENMEMYGYLKGEIIAKVHNRIREYHEKRKSDDVLGLIPPEAYCWKRFKHVDIIKVFENLMLHQNMHELNVNDSTLAIENIGKFRELRKVQINDNQLAVALLPRRDILAKVTELIFNGDSSPNICTDKMMEEIARNCPQLKKLDVRGSRITNACLIHLMMLIHLTELNIEQTKIATWNQAMLCSKMPNLTKFEGADMEDIIKTWKRFKVNHATKLRTVVLANAKPKYKVKYSDLKKYFPDVEDLTLSTDISVTEADKKLGPLPCLVALTLPWNLLFLNLHREIGLKRLTTDIIAPVALFWIMSYFPGLTHCQFTIHKDILDKGYQKISDFKDDLKNYSFDINCLNMLTHLSGQCIILEVLLPMCKNVKVIRVLSNKYKGNYMNFTDPTMSLIPLMSLGYMKKVEIFQTNFCFASNLPEKLVDILFAKCPNLKMLCEAGFNMERKAWGAVGRRVKMCNCDFTVKVLDVLTK